MSDREGEVAAKWALAMVLAAFLAGCGSMHCQEQSSNRHAASECGLFSKF